LQDNNGNYYTVGKTETIKNNLNPVFDTNIVCDFFFEKHQKMIFMVLDGDGREEDASDDDIIGKVETTLGEVVGSSKFEKPITHKGNNNRGTLIVKAETLKDSNQFVELVASAENIPVTKSCFGLCGGASKTRLCIYRGSLDNPDQWSQCFRSD